MKQNALQHKPSTVVAAIAYNDADAVLQVRFISGAVYECKKVPAAVYKAMENAVSTGTYLNKHIKGNFSYKKIK